MKISFMLAQLEAAAISAHEAKYSSLIARHLLLFYTLYINCKYCS